ncbi:MULTISPECIES: DNA-directed RNA polymerase subunit omega [Sediminispirochaeta]|uniref:DNA-directed RNA polymerase subunit omega n=1 Tax=Sediminispirochaeta smaragdinae (strain DSM 11293 / JCM 15392 / SEBR 4228) TaxID=573413 RepID=E1R767_SEDSS|nr:MULTISPECIES: DNA-directed RNA polymerase subunit omega [Sediminispirochaeta]ADK81394.1 RNA polymerase Rpb6 [Sediminispirochaeta smaragdinae DSM 11293]
MPFPLDKLISHQGNVYELTSAAIKRARQITMTGDENLEREHEKVVTYAMGQILEEKVKYRLEE